MANRRYTYEVEIDSSSLAQAEAEIKRRLGGAMAQIAAPAAAQQATRAASDLDRELQKIADIDLTGGIEKMERAIQSLRAEARRLDADLQSAHMTQSTGFASGVKNRTAYSNDERRAILENEARLYAVQGAAARAEREMLQEQIRHWERIAQQATDDEDVFAAMNMVEAAYEEAGDATDRLLLTEREAAENLTQAKRRLVEQAEEVAEEARRAQIRGGDLSAAAGMQSGGRGNAAVYLTVTQPTVNKAGDLAKNIERMAEADQRRAEMLERQAGAEQRRTEEIKKAIAAQSQLERVTREQERQNNLALAHERTAQQLSRERATSMQAANSAARQGTIEAQRALEIERQKTVQIRAQTREQERQAAEQRRAAQVAAATSRSQFDPNAAARGLIMGGLGALGIYGGFEAIGGAYRAGRSGAQDLRMMETYQQLAESVGASAEGMQERIAVASRGTVDSMTAIRLASQVMAQRFAGDLEDMEGDTEILVRFARRASQIYVDESGAMMSSQEIFARLLKFMREGNKELVDQFGLSNQLIADTLGISVDGLASADGAAKRWAGTIQLLGQELDRLGEAQDSTADRFERSEARITNAWNRLKAASADPVAFVIEVSAAGVEGITAAGVDMARELRQTTYNPLRNRRGAAQREAISLTARGMMGSQQWEEATRRAREYEDVLRRLQGAEIVAGANITARTDKGPERSAEMERLQRALDEIANTYTAIDMRGEIGLIDDAQIARAVAELNKLTDDMVAGEKTTTEVAKAAAELRDNLAGASSVFGFMIPQAADFADEVQRAVSITGGRALGLSQFQLDYRMREDPLVAFVEESREARKEENKARLDAIQRETERTQREWESAAKRAQSAWENAAKEAQNAFKSALGNIPGMPGGAVSDVTPEQMLLSRYGLYNNQADEFLRRAKDELVTYTRTVGPDGSETITPIPGKSPVDYAEVDAGDIARRLGVSGGLPPDILYMFLEQQWSSGRLFAGGNNLDLLDTQAIARQMGEQRQGQQGQEAVRNYLAQMGLAAPYDIGAEFGPQITQDMAGNIATAFPEAIAGADIAGPAITAISAQFTAETALNQWREMGRTGGAEFVAGAVAAVGGTNFVGQISAAIKADIMAEIATLLDQ